ncbi:MAG: PAS domain S-box protein, partial [Porticoccus sp.]|nr:PAS domain S-box protein [Porticoccus sp.]
MKQIEINGKYLKDARGGMGHVFLFLLSLLFCLFVTSIFADVPPVESESASGQRNINGGLGLSPEEKSWLAAHPNITFGGGGIPGSDYTDEATGEIIGVGPDYLRAISELLGVPFNFVSHSWKETHELAIKRQIDGIRLLLRNKEREQYLNFSEPYVSMQHSVFQRIGSDQVRAVEELALKESKVAVLHSSYAETYLKNNYPNLNIVPYPIVTDALIALVGHSVDAVIATDISAGQAINDRLLASVEPVTHVPGMEQGLHVGVRKDWPELIPILNKAIKAIPRETHTAIRSKWIDASRSNTLDIALTEAEKGWLAQNHTVHVRVTDYPPFQFIDKEGPSGISVDYLKLIAERTGVKFVFTPETRPFNESLEEMMSFQGPDLIQCMMRTSEREANVSFSQDYFSSPRVIYTVNNGGIIRGIEDLTGKTVAVPRGALVSEQLASQYPAIKLKRFDSDKQALQSVSFGNADAYIGNLTLAAYLISKYNFANLKVAALSPFGDHVFSYGSRKDWPELSSIINKGLESITAEEQTKIRNKYTSIHYEHTENGIIVKWLLVIGGAASGIVLLFVVWNRSLKIQVRERTSELQETNESLASEINERVQTEQALIESESQYRNLVDNSLVGVFNATLSGKFIYINSALAKIYDFENTEQMLAEASVARWKDIAHRHQMLTVLKEQGSVSNFEAETITHSGRHIHVLLSATINNDVISGMVIDITEKTLVENALLESEQRSGAIFEQMAVGIAHVSPEGKFLRINQKFCDIIGYSSQEALKLNFQDITYPEDLNADLDYVDQLLAGTNTNYTMEKRYIRKDRELVWVSLTVALLRDESAQPKLFVSTVEDITERKRVEEALRESNDRFKLWFETANIAICLVDVDGRFIKTNEQMCAMYGYSENELEAMTVNDITHPDDLNISSQFFQQALAGGNSHQRFTKRYLHKDGHIIWGEVSSSIANDLRGKPQYFISYIQDITHRRQADMALREREATLASLLNAPLEIIMLLSRDGTVLSINEGGARRYGESPEAMIGHNIYQSMDSEVAQQRKDYAEQVFQTGKSVHFEDERGGAHFANSVYPVFDIEGEKVVSIAIFSTDITERIETEGKLEEYQQRLKSLLGQLTLAEDRERRLLAGELHDNVGQSLALSRLQLATVRKGLPKG